MSRRGVGVAAVRDNNGASGDEEVVRAGGGTGGGKDGPIAALDGPSPMKDAINACISPRPFGEVWSWRTRWRISLGTSTAEGAAGAEFGGAVEDDV